MKLILGITASLLASLPLGGAVPVKRDTTTATSDDDLTVLNFALSLENLEVAFYQTGLATFSEADFEAAGYEDGVRGRFVEIMENEQTHQRVLTEILGDIASQPCIYSFPLPDVDSFVKTSWTFESVGTSAYTGAISVLEQSVHLVEAAAILATEARQSSWVHSAVLHENPWSTPFETPLDMYQAFSLASPFIKSCPSSNPALPVRAFPALTLMTPSYTPGSTIDLSFDPNAAGAASLLPGGQYHLALLFGLGAEFVSLTELGSDEYSATLPTGLLGTVYALITNNNGTISDSGTVAGPIVLDFPFASNVDESS